MNFAKRISDGITDAMRARDQIRLTVLRSVRNEIIKLTKQASSEEISDAEVLKLIKGQIKQRQDAIVLFEKGGRPDLVSTEKEQLEMLRSLLPDQLSEHELKEIVSASMLVCNATTVKEMGKVMKCVKEAIEKSGKDADNRVVATLVKSRLT